MYRINYTESTLNPPLLPPELEKELTEAADVVRRHNQNQLLRFQAEQAVTNTPAPQRISDFAVAELEVGHAG